MSKATAREVKFVFNKLQYDLNKYMSSRLNACAPTSARVNMPGTLVMPVALATGLACMRLRPRGPNSCVTAARPLGLQSVLLFTAPSRCLRLLPSIAQPPSSPLSRCVIRPETITATLSLSLCYTPGKGFLHPGEERVSIFEVRSL